MINRDLFETHNVHIGHILVRIIVIYCCKLLVFYTLCPRQRPNGSFDPLLLALVGRRDEDGENCGNFYVCVEGRASLKECPFGLFFEQVIRLHLGSASHLPTEVGAGRERALARAGLAST